MRLEYHALYCTTSVEIQIKDEHFQQLNCNIANSNNEPKSKKKREQTKRKKEKNMGKKTLQRSTYEMFGIFWEHIQSIIRGQNKKTS